MRLDRETVRFLDGAAFSNGHRFGIPNQPIVRRNDLLVSLVRDRDVLHVGCADHVPLISEKRRTGTYLHDLLTSSARSVTGTDTDASALEAMRAVGIQELYLPDDLPAGRGYDLVLAPDVIEHVADVGAFLSQLRVHGVPVVVTTPNALRFINRVSFRNEFINTDHRYWFSPYTLAKSLSEADYTVDRIWYTEDSSIRTPARFAATRMFPACRDGIAIVATPS